ncbi:MAG TPA: plastocyanin/azurin family copper-binding protein [Solirubrobacteraceae bacterium]|nr:plastocyanin/azurin family copper-binding protein [Solirubrobacteraceae bacterium]
MHSAVVHFLPVLAAEKSKAPFYIAGGALVAWALILSIGIGMRRPDFPRDSAAQRLVITISTLLVLAAATTAVITSGGSNDAEASASSKRSTQAEGVVPPPTPPPVAAAPATATTGTPAPASSPAAKPAGPLQLAADPGGQLAYDSTQLSAKAGPITIDFANASPVPHNVVIAQASKTLGQTPLKTGPATLKLTLKPGTYTFFCSAPGHRQAGMQGTLTVS